MIFAAPDQLTADFRICLQTSARQQVSNNSLSASINSSEGAYWPATATAASTAVTKAVATAAATANSAYWHGEGSLEPYLGLR